MLNSSVTNSAVLRSGKFIARTLSYEGVEFKQVGAGRLAEPARILSRLPS